MKTRGTALRLLIAAAFLAAGCTPNRVAGGPPADATAGEVAFTLQGQGGSTCVVPVTINGQGPFSFVLDTGASVSVVDAALAKRLKLPASPGPAGFAAGVHNVRPITMHRVDTLQVGTARASGISVGVVDLQHFRGTGVPVDGLIGLNVLKPYRVTIDFRRKVLRLEKS